ncbi:exosome complex component MTR3-like [Portunus trituberculatus]|uniref:exosome complex component MTR3-like n=1 Tax=Portunus trituberculatus TaxID=210409 RepID=UPI001E1CF439|nr:exosome complex component MTR3-like [Portunus trituberculatus]
MGSRDTRRVLGPEKSVCHTLLRPPVSRAFLREDGLRWDGRTPQDPRKLFMSVGMITQAKGSSYVEVGNTKVCCGVYGPKDVQRGQDFKMSGQAVVGTPPAPHRDATAEESSPPLKGSSDGQMAVSAGDCSDP